MIVTNLYVRLLLVFSVSHVHTLFDVAFLQFAWILEEPRHASSNKCLTSSNKKLLVARASLLGARMLLGAPGRTTISKKLQRRCTAKTDGTDTDIRRRKH